MHRSNYNRQPNRFKYHLPLFAILVLNPWFVALLLLSSAVVLSLLSVHYGLALILLILPFCSYYLERNLLDHVLLTPFSVIAFWECVGSGVGVSLIVFANNSYFNESLFKVQLATLAFIVVGWFFYRLGFGKIPKMHFPELRGLFQRDVIRPLVWCGWFFLLFYITGIFVKAASGHLDRGESSVSALGVAGQANFGIWTVFNVFTRFDNFGFFLVPLMWKHSPFTARLLILASLASFFLLALLSGSRGSFLYPIIYIAVGLFFFKTSQRIKLDGLAIVAVALFAPLIILIDSYRTTDAYMSTRTTDISGRFAAFGEAIENLEVRKDKAGGRDKFRVLGASILGRSDSLIYQAIDVGVPHAKFENFDAVLYTFTPTFFVRNKPVLIDSNLIYWDYLGKIDKTGRGMSLPADSYRRFGLVGVPAFGAFFFWLYGVICGKCYKIYFKKDALLGTLLILFTFSFFQFLPFSSVLETWWHLSYNTVKHLLALIVGFWILKKILGIRGKAGLHDYSSHR